MKRSSLFSTKNGAQLCSSILMGVLHILFGVQWGETFSHMECFSRRGLKYAQRAILICILARVFAYSWRGTQTSSSSSRDPNNVMRLTHLESQPKIQFLQTKEGQTALQFKSHRLHRQSTKGKLPQQISN